MSSHCALAADTVELIYNPFIHASVPEGMLGARSEVFR